MKSRCTKLRMYSDQIRHWRGKKLQSYHSFEWGQCVQATTESTFREMQPNVYCGGQSHKPAIRAAGQQY